MNSCLFPNADDFIRKTRRIFLTAIRSYSNSSPNHNEQLLLYFLKGLDKFDRLCLQKQKDQLIYSNVVVYCYIK